MRHYVFNFVYLNSCKCCFPELFITTTKWIYDLKNSYKAFHDQNNCIQIQPIDKEELFMDIKHSIFQGGVKYGLDYNITPPSTITCGPMADWLPSKTGEQSALLWKKLLESGWLNTAVCTSDLYV